MFELKVVFVSLSGLLSHLCQCLQVLQVFIGYW
jgi:hypothetical protein